MADFRQQDVVAQLVPVLSHDALLEMAHGVGAAEADLLVVEIELALGLCGFILDEAAHTEVLLGGVTEAVVLIVEVYLQLIEPGGLGLPALGLGQVEGDAEVIDAGAHVLIDTGVVELVDVAMAANLAGLRLVAMALEHRLAEVAAIDGQFEFDRLVANVAVVDFDPGFDGLLFR